MQLNEKGKIERKEENIFDRNDVLNRE